MGQPFDVDDDEHRQFRADVDEQVRRWRDSQVVIDLTRLSTPEEIFGPVDLEQLKANQVTDA